MNGPERDVGFLLGLPFHVITMDETIEDAVAHIKAGKPGYYITPNADFIAQAYNNEALKEILFHADRVVCDGMPLVWLSRYFKPALPERVAGSDMVFRLFAEADRHQWKVYFLGSEEVTLAQTKAILKNDYPAMEVVGTFSPPFGPVDAWPNERILKEIAETRPDLLLVAVGCPKQEYWIARYSREAGVPLSIGIGASLDFICGTQTRAPIWVQKIGMEWFWRLLTNPRRLLKRYVKDFYYLILLAQRQRRLMVNCSQFVSDLSHGEKVASDEELPTQDQEMFRANCHSIKWQGFVERTNLEAHEGPTDYSKPILLDLSEVTFIDSSGVGRLAKIAREARAASVPFGLIRPSVAVVRIIDAMHLRAQLPVYNREDEATASFEKRADV
jgi:N-acetylglucosaminyldiphosphoundecaprenol N-acetyl-beta-D-mannosaminyltransferase